MKRLWCTLRGHDMRDDNRLRLVVLTDTWPAKYIDGLGPGTGTRCTRCGMEGVR